MILTLVIRTVRACLQHQKDIGTLHALDSRRLADIGLTHGEVTRYASLRNPVPAVFRNVE
jgi:uncharacterized protein YjiS (DUF1127 family)